MKYFFQTKIDVTSNITISDGVLDSDLIKIRSITHKLGYASKLGPYNFQILVGKLLI